MEEKSYKPKDYNKRPNYNQKPKVSVIMPIYNTNPRYLKKAIKSVLNQTFDNFEFLILNDSPKNLELDEIIGKFYDQRIRYFKSEKNEGVAEAHNRLLKEAKGKYIAVMDHDDISLKRRFEKEVEYMDAHPEIGIVGAAYRRIGNVLKWGVIRHPTNHDEIYALSYFKCPIHHPSSMIRKSILDEYGISYDKSFISLNDRKLYYEIGQHAQLHNLPDILYKYRMHANMTSKLRRQEIQEEVKEYREYILEKAGIKLTADDKNILFNYILTGRSKIKDFDTLKAIETVLSKLVKCNSQKHFCNEEILNKICGMYLIKRCKNALFRGLICSKEIIEQTTLPIENYPWYLKLFNNWRTNR